MGIIIFIISGILGAIAMFFLDPETGKRRREQMRDQATKLQKDAQERVTKLQKDAQERLPNQLENAAESAANRLRGAVAETARRLKLDDTSNETLVARIRSEMGQYVSQPDAVNVTAADGVVTLTGSIPTSEAAPFVAKVNTISGVKQVQNWLQQHDEPDNVSNLHDGLSTSGMS